MRAFVDWLNDPDKGFYVREAWDIEKGWVGVKKLTLLNVQERILRHALTPSIETGLLPYQTIVYSTIKKSGKTTIGAAIGCWAMQEGREGAQGYALANSKEHAEILVYDDMAFHFRRAGIAKPKKDKIDLGDGKHVTALATANKTVAGVRPSVTVWDELWGFESEDDRRVWAEMTPPPTVPNTLRVIVTYAGYTGESELLWSIYEKFWLQGEIIPELADIVNSAGEPVCRRKGDVFVFWDDMPRMPWQTDAYYTSQADMLRPAEYRRLHQNKWVTTHDEAFPIEKWDKCTTLTAPLTINVQDPRRQLPMYVGVDGSIKHDTSSVVGVYYDTTREIYGLGFHKIWTPTPDEPMDLEETVEKYLLQMWNMFNIILVLYDPTQLHRSMTTLKKKTKNEERFQEYPQSGTNMITASQDLYDLMRYEKLEVYPDPIARSHIQFATAEEKGRGFRIVKDLNTKNPIDFAVAMALAVHGAIHGAQVGLPKPLVFQDIFNEDRKIIDPAELKLPEELRS